MKKDLTTGTDVVYLYDGWSCIEEREFDDPNWEARRQYVYGGQYIDEVLLFDKDTNDDGVCDDARYIYCQDANFNVVALTDNVGVIVEKTWYEAYGKPTWYYSGAEQTSSSVANPYLFQGRRWDADSNLYYFRNRDLLPPLGRFLQRDPIGYNDGMNLYEWLKSNPLYYADPTGHSVAVPVVVGGAAGAGVAVGTIVTGTVVVVGVIVIEELIRRGIRGWRCGKGLADCLNRAMWRTQQCTVLFTHQPPKYYLACQHLHQQAFATRCDVALAICMNSWFGKFHQPPMFCKKCLDCEGVWRLAGS